MKQISDDTWTHKGWTIGGRYTSLRQETVSDDGTSRSVLVGLPTSPYVVWRDTDPPSGPFQTLKEAATFIESQIPNERKI